MLKESFKKSILDCLNKVPFSESEFILEETEDKDFWSKINVLTIRWRIEKDFYYKISISGRKTTSNENKTPHFEFKTTYSPGELSDEEAMNFSDENSLHDSINIWLSMIEEQVINTGNLKILRNRLEQQEIIIMSITEKIDGLTEESFSDVEEETINNKLDEIRAEINRKLDEQSSKNEAQRNELIKMKQEIEFLKNTIEQMNKKDWFKMLAFKIFNWTKNPENKQLLSKGIEVAKLALPEDVKKIIDKD